MKPVLYYERTDLVIIGHIQGGITRVDKLFTLTDGTQWPAMLSDRIFVGVAADT